MAVSFLWVEAVINHENMKGRDLDGALEDWRRLSEDERQQALDALDDASGPGGGFDPQCPKCVARRLLHIAARAEFWADLEGDCAPLAVPGRRSAQAESSPAPKLNEDERQCDYCGRVYHESEVADDICYDCRGYNADGSEKEEPGKPKP